MSTAQIIPSSCSPSDVEVYLRNSYARHDLQGYYTPPPSQDKPESEQDRLDRWNSMLQFFSPPQTETMSVQQFIERERAEEELLDKCISRGVPYRVPVLMETKEESDRRCGEMLKALEEVEMKNKSEVANRLLPLPPDSSGDNNKKPAAAAAGGGGGGGGGGAGQSKSEKPGFPFLLIGTLCYVDEGNLRRHIIRGNWTDVAHTAAAAVPQKFELLRNIPPEEDVTQLPMDGEFNGSLNIPYKVKNSMGKMEIKNLTVAESGVTLSFKEDKARRGGYSVNGKGKNAFGVFELIGTASKADAVGKGDGNKYNIEIHKKYVAHAVSPVLEKKKKKMEKKKKKKKKKKKDKKKHSSSQKKDKTKGGVTNSTPKSNNPRPTPVTPESGGSFARSIIEREQEEVELAGRCKLLEVAYIPPEERETKEQTLQRRELLKGWCREYENKKKPAVGGSIPAGGQNECNQSTKRKATEAPEAKEPSPKKNTYSRQPSVQSDPYYVYNAKYAATLQREETRLAEEGQQMLSAHAGRAYKFVEKILEECRSLEKKHVDVGIKPVAVDDMVHMTENMLKCQETFKEANKNAQVDIGFHFTSESVLKHIQRDGLMTMEDRESNPKLNPQEAGRKHGLAFGDGVYTGNVPADIKRYGNVGLLVIRLQGKTKRINPNDVELIGTLEKFRVRVKAGVGTGQEAMREGYDTVIGNKRWSTTPNRQRYDEIVLLQSCQVVPLLMFKATLVPDNSTTIPAAFLPWVNAMKKIVDDFFHKPETVLQSLVGASSSSAALKPPPLPNSAVPRASFYAARKLPLPNNLDPMSSSAPQNPLPNSAVTRKPSSNSGTATKPPPPNLRASSILPAAAATKQQGQKPPPAGTQAKINSGWRNDVRDAQERKKIVDAIVQMFRRHPNISQELLNRLPQMATKVEDVLYKKASSLEEYKDLSTLKQRLNQLKFITTGLSQSSNQTIPSNLRRSSSTASVSEAVIRYNAPDTLPSSDTNMLETPKECTFDSNDECGICHTEPLGQDATKLSKSKKCNHVFHKKCFLEELRHRSKCPVCQIGIGVPIGKSPSGEMRVSTKKNMSCEGFSNVGTIFIDYKMFSGVQKVYHGELGRSFKGVNRRAFLPDNEDGRNLLKRLKWAFSHGLTFCIGTSLTTNRSGVITWASIHHKTSTKKGAHGWPDSTYFTRCNEELDNRGVPKAANCS